MTRKQKERDVRPWLRTEQLVVTHRLRKCLEQNPSLEPEVRRDLARVLHVVVRESTHLSRFTNIHSRVWKNKIGKNYTELLDLLVKWKCLDVNKSFSHGKQDPLGNFTKSYRLFGVSETNRDTKLVVMEFPLSRIEVFKDQSDPRNDVSRFIHGCLKQLSVREELVQVKRPDRSVFSVEVSKKVFGKKFDLKSGTHVRRLYHTIISGVSEARYNLIHPDSPDCNLCYVDLVACHPNLLVRWIEDGQERSRYLPLLNPDLYEVVKHDTKSRRSRGFIKQQVSKFLSDKDHKQGSLFGKWLKMRFPILHQRVLGNHDMARDLQNLEADIFVERLGRWCMDRKLFYVSMHDGFLCLPQHRSELVNQAKVVFEDLLGHKPSFKVTDLTPEEFYRRQDSGEFNRS